jgi:hypothetical protein
MAKGKIVSVVLSNPFNNKGKKGLKGNVAVTWIAYCGEGTSDPKTADIGACYPCYEKLSFKPKVDVLHGTKPGTCVSFEFNLMSNPEFLVATKVKKIADKSCK